MVTITVHTMKSCHWCQKWVREEQPYLDPNWQLNAVDGGASSFPTFEVDVDGKTRTLVGFQTVSQLFEVIQQLKNE